MLLKMGGIMVFNATFNNISVISWQFFQMYFSNSTASSLKCFLDGSLETVHKTIYISYCFPDMRDLKGPFFLQILMEFSIFNSL